jgi:uncharacterized protein (TIRG00374 family)
VNKRLFWDLFKYLLAFGLLGWVVWANWGTPGSNGLGDVWQRHVVEGKPIHLQLFLLALVLYGVSVVITLLRWYILVRAQDLPFTVTAAMRLGMIGVFFNSFLPGAVGGDIIKAAFLAREQSRRTVAVATVIMDRALALWALVWFVAILGGIFWMSGFLEGSAVGPALVIVVASAAIVVISTAAWLLLGLLPQRGAERFAERLNRIPKIGHSAAEFWRAVWIYRCRQGAVALTMLVTWVGMAGFVLAFYCCAQVLWNSADGLPLPTLAQHFLLVPIGLVIEAVPLFPGGAGIGEMGFGSLYVLFGSVASLGILASLVRRVIIWTVGLIGGLVYLGLKNSDRPAVASTATTPSDKAPSSETVPSVGAA